MGFRRKMNKKIDHKVVNLNLRTNIPERKTKDSGKYVALRDNKFSSQHPLFSIFYDYPATFETIFAVRSLHGHLNVVLIKLIAINVFCGAN